MILIPAVDIKGGKCVRLRQGAMDQETIYAQDPVSAALRWIEEGASRLHLVDLDGAVSGVPTNLAPVKAILSRAKVAVQVGGGVRNMETLKAYMDAGATAVVLGTSVLLDRSFVEEACGAYPGRIIAGIDVRGGKVAIRGWTALVEEPLFGLLEKMGELGFSAVVLTDIGRDGMLQGPNLELLRDILPKSPVPLIASGGVSSLEDVRRLSQIRGLFGAIVGKALYAGTLSLREAIDLLGG